MNTVKVQPDGLSWTLERTTGGIGLATTVWQFVPPAGSYVMCAHVGRPHSGAAAAGLYSLLIEAKAGLGATLNTTDVVELAFELLPVVGGNNITAGPVACTFDGRQSVTVTAVATSNGYTQGTVALYPVATPDHVQGVAGKVSA